ncbi:MAG: cyclic pyranopterin monophosphate synthase MoaC [Pseudomonadota bacterium]|uniref:Cyclic pyranopterin monophosphate synthase n=1 Tax=Candidatus Desulfatibia profunda TaxID=2841695 RepID=A0A8J6TL08_9BACT|nr:cyclic pyranopterin monophosphate synthase MoaC [Candidatus Desulfatibia profunda]
MQEFTHIDKHGHVRMVDVTDKEATLRMAVAQGVVAMNPATFEKIENQTVQKGNVLEAARIAGIMAAKKTSELIPMCHSLNITHIQIDFFPDKDTSSIRIEASVRIVGQTGVEMEALTAVSVTALTIYDMCKSYDRKMTMSDICLVEKSGGKSGPFIRKKDEL